MNVSRGSTVRGLGLIFTVVLGFFLACGPPKQEEGTTWTEQGIKTLNCQADINCQPYEACVQGGWVRCDRGHCTGVNNDKVDFQCVIDVYTEHDQGGTSTATTTQTTSTNPPSPGTLVCGAVAAPVENVACCADRSHCNFYGTAPQGSDEFRPWMDAVCDTPPCTLTVVSFSVYGVMPNGTIVPAGGSAAGQAPVTWAGEFNRKPWFNPGAEVADWKGKINPSYTFDVPTNPYLIEVGMAGMMKGAVEGIVTAEIRTTGDARVKIGFDYYQGNTRLYEGAMSDWKSCNTGATVSFTTPWSSHLSCDASLGNVCVPSPEVCNGKDDDCDGQVDEGGVCAPPPSNCPPTGIKMTAGPKLLGGCPNLVLITWGLNGATFMSDPGKPLTIGQTWQGAYAYVDAICNGQYYTASWVKGQNLAQAGFSEICVEGQVVTTNTFVCHDQYSNVERPSVPLSLADVGHCP